MKYNTMIKMFMIVMFIFVGIMTTGCHKVTAGHVGIKVHLYGGDKGVDIEEVSVGRYWKSPTVDYFNFPTFTQNYVWTMDPTEGSKNDESIKFQTEQGLTVGADVGISYHIQPDKVTLIFQKYRKGVVEITDIFLRNMVRDGFVQAASTKSIESVIGAGKTELINEVQELVRSQVEDFGIIIEKIYLIGELRLPETVVKALNAKIKATQKAQQRQNEIAEAEAEAKKVEAAAVGRANAILTEAYAQAKANTVVAASLTPELIQYKALVEWDGVLPKLTGGGAIPMIQLGDLIHQ